MDRFQTTPPPPPFLATHMPTYMPLKTWRNFFMEIAITCTPVVLSAYVMYKIFIKMDPTKEEGEGNDGVNKEGYTELIAHMKKNGKKNFSPPNKYEEKILCDVVFPTQMSVVWDDIGGMETLKTQIQDSLILPLQNPNLFKANRINPSQTSLAVAPRGVLFYGPPGTGKTMVAKVIAKQCGATFINVTHSSLQNKWFGESQKLIRALFSVAKKLQPSILFIDEIDMFFRERSSSDHEATTSMKSEFMSLWDGIMTDDNCQITVLGATNHPNDIDIAILRRLPRTFHFGLPTVDERKLIIDVQLKNQRLSDDFDTFRVAAKTEGYSGSDLKEVCKYACMLPINKVIQDHRLRDARRGNSAVNTVLAPGVVPAPLSNADMDVAVRHVRKTGDSSREYKRTQLDEEEQLRKGNSGSNPSGSKYKFDMSQEAFAEIMQQMMMQGFTASPPAPVDEQDLPPIDEIED